MERSIEWVWTTLKPQKQTDAAEQVSELAPYLTEAILSIKMGEKRLIYAMQGPAKDTSLFKWNKYIWA